MLLEKKWNNEILPVGFDYLDKISLQFADITWISSASLGKELVHCGDYSKFFEQCLMQSGIQVAEACECYSVHFCSFSRAGITPYIAQDFFY